MNLSAAQMQRKREKKAARRRFLNAKRKRYLLQFGAYVGGEMYRAWRRRDNPRAFPKKATPPPPRIEIEKRKPGFFERLIAAIKTFIRRIAHATYGRPPAPAN